MMPFLAITIFKMFPKNNTHIEKKFVGRHVFLWKYFGFSKNSFFVTGNRKLSPTSTPWFLPKERKTRFIFFFTFLESLRIKRKS